jgi:hypothetical protein
LLPVCCPAQRFPLEIFIFSFTLVSAPRSGSSFAQSRVQLGLRLAAWCCPRLGCSACFLSISSQGLRSRARGLFSSLRIFRFPAADSVLDFLQLVSIYSLGPLPSVPACSSAASPVLAWVLGKPRSASRSARMRGLIVSLQ